jgi:hypothetical protein
MTDTVLERPSVGHEIYSRRLSEIILLRGRGDAVAQLVETLRYKSKGRGFDPRWCHIILPVALWPWGRPNSNKNGYQE